MKVVVVSRRHVELLSSKETDNSVIDVPKRRVNALCWGAGKRV